MAELRRDPMTGIWSLIAGERGLRPNDFSAPRVPSRAVSASCPFCPGHEAETPPEIDAVRREPAGPWQARLFANKYPAFSSPAQADTRTMLTSTPLETRAPAVGAHEVVVVTPDHRLRTCDLPVEALDAALALCQHRARTLLDGGVVQHFVLMENYGPQAGASREHAHWQIMGSPVVLPQLASKCTSFAAHEEHADSCLACDELAHELGERVRVVAADDHYVTYAPFAGRLPYEMRLAPRVHQRSFVEMTSGMRRRLAMHLREALTRLGRAAGDPPYNWVLVTAPSAPNQPFHWHLEILPRLTMQAGFEWGAGAYINPLAPETAAERLRDALP